MAIGDLRLLGTTRKREAVLPSTVGNEVEIEFRLDISRRREMDAVLYYITMLLARSFHMSILLEVMFGGV
jgi:hypothetical protein